LKFEVLYLSWRVGQSAGIKLPAFRKPSVGSNKLQTMKIFIVLIITFVSFRVSGQNGYVKLIDSDSTMFGFIKRLTPGLELWRSKKDKNPLKILLNNVQEYAINKDTFRILRNFKLYEDRDDYFDFIETKVISKGKVNLFIVDNYRNKIRQMMLSPPDQID
jgi:hypothetical protein